MTIPGSRPSGASDPSHLKPASQLNHSELEDRAHRNKAIIDLGKKLLDNRTSSRNHRYLIGKKVDGTYVYVRKGLKAWLAKQFGGIDFKSVINSDSIVDEVFSSKAEGDLAKSMNGRNFLRGAAHLATALITKAFKTRSDGRLQLLEALSPYLIHEDVGLEGAEMAIDLIKDAFRQDRRNKYHYKKDLQYKLETLKALLPFLQHKAVREKGADLAIDLLYKEYKNRSRERASILRVLAPLMKDMVLSKESAEKCFQMIDTAISWNLPERFDLMKHLAPPLFKTHRTEVQAEAKRMAKLVILNMFKRNDRDIGNAFDILMPWIDEKNIEDERDELSEGGALAREMIAIAFQESRKNRAEWLEFLQPYLPLFKQDRKLENGTLVEAGTYVGFDPSITRLIATDLIEICNLPSPRPAIVELDRIKLLTFLMKLGIDDDQLDQIEASIASDPTGNIQELEEQIQDLQYLWELVHSAEREELDVKEEIRTLIRKANDYPLTEEQQIDFNELVETFEKGLLTKSIADDFAQYEQYIEEYKEASTIRRLRLKAEIDLIIERQKELELSDAEQSRAQSLFDEYQLVAGFADGKEYLASIVDAQAEKFEAMKAETIQKNFSVALEEFAQKQRDYPQKKFYIGRDENNHFKVVEGLSAFWNKLTGRLDFKDLTGSKDHGDLFTLFDKYHTPTPRGENDLVRNAEELLIERALTNRIKKLTASKVPNEEATLQIAKALAVQAKYFTTHLEREESHEEVDLPLPAAFQTDREQPTVSAVLDEISRSVDKNILEGRASPLSYEEEDELAEFFAGVDIEVSERAASPANTRPLIENMINTLSEEQVDTTVFMLKMNQIVTALTTNIPRFNDDDLIRFRQLLHVYNTRLETFGPDKNVKTSKQLINSATSMLLQQHPSLMKDLFLQDLHDDVSGSVNLTDKKLYKKILFASKQDALQEFSARQTEYCNQIVELYVTRSFQQLELLLARASEYSESARIEIPTLIKQLQRLPLSKAHEHRLQFFIDHDIGAQDSPDAMQVTRATDSLIEEILTESADETEADVVEESIQANKLLLDSLERNISSCTNFTSKELFEKIKKTQEQISEQRFSGDQYLKSNHLIANYVEKSLLQIERLLENYQAQTANAQIEVPILFDQLDQLVLEEDDMDQLGLAKMQFENLKSSRTRQETLKNDSFFERGAPIENLPASPRAKATRERMFITHSLDQIEEIIEPDSLGVDHLQKIETILMQMKNEQLTQEEQDRLQTARIYLKDKKVTDGELRAKLYKMMDGISPDGRYQGPIQGGGIDEN